MTLTPGLNQRKSAQLFCRCIVWNFIDCYLCAEKMSQRDHRTDVTAKFYARRFGHKLNFTKQVRVHVVKFGCPHLTKKIWICVHSIQRIHMRSCSDSDWQHFALCTTAYHCVPLDISRRLSHWRTISPSNTFNARVWYSEICDWIATIWTQQEHVSFQRAANLNLTQYFRLNPSCDFPYAPTALQPISNPFWNASS